jgi:hypothetical protein
MIFNGVRVVWGIPMELKPVTGLSEMPHFHFRLKLRPKAPASVYMRTEDGLREFILKDCGDHWEPAFEVGRNYRPGRIFESSNFSPLTNGCGGRGSAGPTEEQKGSDEITNQT